jgi:hypothetical protein
MKVRDDDDIHRARMVYLGPPDHTLPIQLPYAQWGMGFVFTAVLFVILLLLTGNVIWIGAAICGGGFLTHFLWRFVDADRPARTVIRTALMDTKTIKPDDVDVSLPRLVASNITIHEYPEG